MTEDQVQKIKMQCYYCDRKSVYIVEDNESLKGYTKVCKRHLLNAVKNAFGFNLGNRKKDDYVTVKMISRLTTKDKEGYDIYDAKR